MGSLADDLGELILDGVLDLSFCEADLLVGVIEGNDVLLEERESELSILALSRLEEDLAFSGD